MHSIRKRPCHMWVFVMGCKEVNDVDILSHSVIINAQYYGNLLQNVHQAILKQIHGKLLKKIILLHDNACPHMANLTKVTLTTMAWKIMNFPPCSHDLVPSDQHLFGPIEVHLGGQISNWWWAQHGVLNWLVRIKSFMLLASVTFQDDWKDVLV
jgi:hypothetical protein